MESFRERDRQRVEESSWRTYFDHIAPTYEREYTEHPFWTLYNEITWATIQRYLPKDRIAPILDAGGGTGFWSRKLGELGYKVICADISVGMLHEGKKLVKTTPIDSRIEFVCMNIEDMGAFPDDCFSLVLAEGDPLSYCNNPDSAVREMVRVARSGAHVIASADSFFGALWRMIQTKDFQELDLLLRSGDTTYAGSATQHNFTVEELRNLYLQNGLEIMEIIGKPIFVMAHPWEKMRNMLSDERQREILLQLELKFNKDPNIVGLGNHLEIVGRKR